MADSPMKFSLRIDNTEEYKKATQEGIRRALTAIGMRAQSYAVGKCPTDTGLLKNSISYAVYGEPSAVTEYATNANRKNGEPVTKPRTGSYTGNAPRDKQAVYIGTNVSYAA